MRVPLETLQSGFTVDVAIAVAFTGATTLRTCATTESMIDQSDHRSVSWLDAVIIIFNIATAAARASGNTRMRVPLETLQSGFTVDVAIAVAFTGATTLRPCATTVSMIDQIDHRSVSSHHGGRNLVIPNKKLAVFVVSLWQLLPLAFSVVMFGRDHYATFSRNLDGRYGIIEECF